MTKPDFRRFHDELQAAWTMRVPLEIGTVKSVQSKKLLTQDHLTRLEKLTATDNLAGNPILSNKVHEFPPRLRAAAQVFEDTQSMPAVLDGLTVRRDANETIVRAARRTIFYLGLLFLVGILGVYLLRNTLIPSLQIFRADLKLSYNNAPLHADAIQWLVPLTNVLFVAFTLFFLVLVTGGGQKIAMLLGGRRYVHSRVSNTILNLVQLLSESGVPVSKSFETCCDLTGANQVVRSKLAWVQESDGRGHHLTAQAEYYEFAGSAQLNNLKLSLPSLLVTTIGGLSALLFCLVVFWPVISMFQDMVLVEY